MFGSDVDAFVAPLALALSLHAHKPNLKAKKMGDIAGLHPPRSRVARAETALGQVDRADPAQRH